VSCQNSAKKNVTEIRSIAFDEMNHVNLKLISSEYKVMESQKEINAVYGIVNDDKNNPSPRKSPILGYSDKATTIVLQPILKTNDFLVSEINLEGNVLNVKIEPFDNPQFDKNKGASAIIMLAEPITFKKLKILK